MFKAGPSSLTDENSVWLLFFLIHVQRKRGSERERERERKILRKKENSERVIVASKDKVSFFFVSMGLRFSKRKVCRKWGGETS